MAETVNKDTARAATLQDKLPLDELRLLGIISRPDGAEALLRLPSGHTLMAGVGSQTEFGEVRAIDDRTLVLDTGRGSRRLELLS